MSAINHVFALVPNVAYVDYKALDDNETVWISWIQAPPGKGVKLLRTFEKSSRKKGYKRIQLETCAGGDEMNDVVLRRFAFFQKMGYRFVSLQTDTLVTVGTVLRFKREKIL